MAASLTRSPLHATLRRWRDSMWFLPAVLVLVAMALADLAVRAEELGWVTSSVLWGPELGVEGARSVLTAVATVSLGVAATAFSITVAVIATASATYGPRLVRNFMTDRSNQWVLGILVATFLYSLLVLRSVGGRAEGDFVPQLGVDLALLAAVVCVGALVHFIHHVADSIQIATLTRGARSRLVEVVAEQWSSTGEPEVRDPVQPVGTGEPLRSTATGYVTVRDTAALVDAARRHDAVVTLVVAVGDHVVDGEVLAYAHPGAGQDPDPRPGLAGAVQQALNIGPERTTEQDVRFALRQVLEMAVRALSPGTNDPYTAVQAVDELTAGVLAMVGPRGERTHAPEGRPVLHWPVTDRAEVVRMVFDELLPYADDHPIVLEALVRLAARVRDTGTSPEVVDAAGAGVEHLRQRADAFGYVPRARERLDAVLSRYGFHPV